MTDYRISAPGSKGPSSKFRLEVKQLASLPSLLSFCHRSCHLQDCLGMYFLYLTKVLAHFPPLTKRRSTDGGILSIDNYREAKHRIGA